MRAADHFADAMRVDDYIARMTTKREPFLEHIERTLISDEVRQRFSRQPLNVLVFTEDWCNDSVQFIPMLIRLAREVPQVEVRILSRDENRELAAQYPRKDGYQAIPIFVLFDEEMNEIGVMVERPAQVSAEIAAETRRFAQANPHLDGVNRNIDRMPEETKRLVKANNSAWRVAMFDRWQPYFFDELGALVGSGSRVSVA